MSKQFQIYALPSDIEALLQNLQEYSNVELLGTTSEYPEPTNLPSPIRSGSVLNCEKSMSINCYISSGDLADVRLKQYPGDSLWHIDDASEVVSISGFDFDGETLLRGRMYFQTDYLSGSQILDKREEFLRWANEIFSRSKKLLIRSRELDCYIGHEARSWALKGGKFASFAALGRQPIYERYSGN